MVYISKNNKILLTLSHRSLLFGKAQLLRVGISQPITLSENRFLNEDEIKETDKYSIFIFVDFVRIH